MIHKDFKINKNNLKIQIAMTLMKIYQLKYYLINNITLEK